MEREFENGGDTADFATASLDDPALANLASELGADGNEDLQSLLERVNQMMEFVENDKTNALLNFPLYGLLLNELLALQCIKPYESVFKKFLDEYLSSLDTLDAHVAAVFPRDDWNRSDITDLPSLINEMRSDGSFAKQRKKELKLLSSDVPDLKKNLETIETIILGM
ncbi:MAG: hypothetical protein GXP32_04960 [Kiritimatiellaeota bacterium]|nr:hypothetical protein [Kiritimatiellota bacterium]